MKKATLKQVVKMIEDKVTELNLKAIINTPDREVFVAVEDVNPEVFAQLEAYAEQIESETNKTVFTVNKMSASMSKKIKAVMNKDASEKEVYANFKNTEFFNKYL